MMDASDVPPDGSNRGEVGIAAARYVYGPANVHLLPCKVHHTGSAPVSTYFRPQPPKDSKNMTPVVDEVKEKGIAGDGHLSNEDKSQSAVVAREGKGEETGVKLEDDTQEHTARFRGRKLIGRKVELPTGIHGVVLREQPCPEGLREDEDVTAFWAAEASFRDITVWGHDEIRRQSTVDRCLAWLEVSNSIHDP